ncbi:hypothetical protein RND81_08G130400 [Saponaria officinalis]|uniref:S-protein homolog n=1 Tax=Saponaria officinalis TaxID=3572 RepID=A0AAW1J5X8_SAPOF
MNFLHFLVIFAILSYGTVPLADANKNYTLKFVNRMPDVLNLNCKKSGRQPAVQMVPGHQTFSAIVNTSRIWTVKVKCNITCSEGKLLNLVVFRDVPAFTISCGNSTCTWEARSDGMHFLVAENLPPHIHEWSAP